MKIITIDEKSPYLEKVIELAQLNASTLGFLPKGAFFNQAANEQIFVAIDENERVIGYLLYGINYRQSKQLAYITHLCVDQSQRKKGTARALFNKLKEATKHRVRGIRVRCRRDYEARKLWPKLGFQPLGEIPGRSKHKTTLTEWWFDYGYPTLFTYIAQKQTEKRLKVVIDANIFYELDEPPTSANQRSQVLMADWLDVELCLTNEILTEINRHDDESVRRRARSLAQTRYLILPSSDDEVQKICQDLRGFFPLQMSESGESDMRQIANTVASGVQFFVTHDDLLLRKTDQIYDRFGIRIICPADLIIYQDTLTREMEYQPSRLAGSLIKIQRVHSQQSSHLENCFREQNENKKDFRRKLQPCLVDPHIFEVKVVVSGEQLLALVIYSRQNSDILEIPVFRIVQNPLSPTLARYLVLRAVLISAKEKRRLTQVTDTCLSDNIIDALQEIGFFYTSQIWVKANLCIAEEVGRLSEILAFLGREFVQVDQYFHQLLNALEIAQNENDLQTLLQIERFLWPAKIVDIEIPAYIVPIWPEWAMHLFDLDIAGETLFGADPELMFNVENVYYRASRPILEAPARVLWYVSQGRGNFQGTMSIRACSYLDEVIVDKPKVLFSRFKRLGVYAWDDVYKVAKKDVNKDIMAFRFSNTELFNNPIDRGVLQEMWIKEKGKNFNIQGPIKISNNIFFRLYRFGS